MSKTWIGLMAIAGLTACGGGNSSVQCEVNAHCSLETGGTCDTNPESGNRWCSYPDDTCPSGRRWSDLDTGDNLGGTCQPDWTGPMVVSTSPDADGTDVAYDSAITVTFSEDIDTATVDDTSFLVEDDQGRTVTGTVTADGTTATFTPDAPMTYEGGYTATVTTAVTDTAGNPLASEHVWSFTTHLRQWRTAEVIDGGSGGDGPTVEMDDQGRGLAMWQGSDSNLWASRYLPGTGWDTPVPVSDVASNVAAVNWALSGNAGGDAMAIWKEADLSTYVSSLHVSRFRADSGTWEAPIQLDSDVDFAPGVAIGGSGRAIAAWNKNSSVMASIYDGTTWSVPEPLSAATGSRFDLVIDADGTAIAVWLESDGTHSNVWANRFSRQSGWGVASLIETEDSGDAYFPRVATDASGNAIAVWSLSNATGGRDLWTNRYDAAANSWGVATELQAGGDSTYAALTMRPGGDAFFVWLQAGDIVGKRYDASSQSWMETQLIEDHPGDAGAPDASMDPNGNIVAVWQQKLDNTVWSVRARRYVAGVGWSLPETIESSGNPSAFPQIATDATGNALCVWREGPGLGPGSIWSNRRD